MVILMMKERAGLSDYWAQEMIGADLLKEMLEKQAPVEKKNFIQVLDSPYLKHDEYVKNIISSDGRHSVLPNLGDKIRTFDLRSVSNYLKHSNTILSERDKACGKPPHTESDGQPGFKPKPPHTESDGQPGQYNWRGGGV